MATTSIWRVNGWLGKVLIYIENPDKTENPDFFEKQDMDGKEAQGLSDVIEYAVQQQKTGKTVESEGETVMRQFVSGVNCSPSTARDEMIAVKKRFGKEDGTVAYHGYQSFAPGEATPTKRDKLSRSGKKAAEVKAAPEPEKAPPENAAPAPEQAPPEPAAPPRPVEEGKLVYLKLSEMHPFHHLA